MSAVARRDGDSGDYSDSQDVERNSTNDGPLESDYDSAASDSEHSDQDQDSQETERRVDDDEDRSNPQYIPKRGTFYEHDDRTAASGEETTNTTSETSSEKKEGGSPVTERRRAPRKSEVIDRWSHDKYNENEQAPKSRDELVAIYGYDIRNEDAPPHARRNRRYGRGPNKYTRTWEDEEAYRRQTAAQAPRKPPNPEDFPDLETANKHSNRRTRGPRPRSKSQPTSNESLSNGTSLRRNASIKAKPERKPERKPSQNQTLPNKTNNNVKKNDSYEKKLPAIENLVITTTVVNNNQSLTNGTSLRRNASIKAKPERKPERKPNQNQTLPNKTNNNVKKNDSYEKKLPAIENLVITTTVVNNNQSLSNGTSLRRNASIKAKPERKPERKPNQNQTLPNKTNNNVKKNDSYEKKLPAIENLVITTTVVNNNQNQAQRKVNAAVAQQRPVPTEQGKKKPTAPVQPVSSPGVTSAPAPHKPAPAQPHAAQPAATESRGGSKRYSSLRQRPLAETYSPQQPQQQQQQQQPQQPQQPQHRYHPEYANNAPPANQHQTSPAPQLHPQQLIHQVHRNANPPPHGPSPPHQNLPQAQHSQQVRLGIVEQPPLLPHPHHSLHNLPPQPHAMVGPAPIQQAQGYAPSAMMPAQYMQQGANNAVFGAAPIYAQPPPQPYPHQIYQHHNYAPTQAGGVTYYSPAEQEPPAPVPRPQRRPTAAIPIVRPDRPANSSEKDNIDRIVENMFVRKPWPAQQSIDGSKDKDNRNSQEPQSKESSQPNSLTSSSISTDSKPSEKEREHTEPEQREEDKKCEVKDDKQECIATDA